MGFSLANANNVWGAWLRDPACRPSRLFWSALWMIVPVAYFLARIPAERYTSQFFLVKGPQAFLSLLVIFVLMYAGFSDQHIWATSRKNRALFFTFSITYIVVMISGLYLGRTDAKIPVLGFSMAHVTPVMAGILPIWISLAWFSMIFYSYPFCTYRKYKRGIMLTLGVVLSFTAIANGFLDPEVVRVEIPLQGLPTVFDGFEICMLSDMHMGPDLENKRIQRAVDIANSLPCDLILLNGDIGEGQVAHRGEQLLLLQNLSATHGVFYVVGNHEFYNSEADGGSKAEVNRYFKFFQKTLQNEGNPNLVNRAVRITRDDSSGESFSFLFAGLDDVKQGDPNLEKMLQDAHKDDVVVLAQHNPQDAESNLLHPNVQLQLSGHTHGGQIFPVHLPTNLSGNFLSGIFHLHDKLLYVGEGTFGSCFARARLGS